MLSIVTVLLIVAMAATLGVLIVGVVGMATGGAFNARYSNKLMRLRILTQGVAIVLFIIFMILKNTS